MDIFGFDQTATNDEIRHMRKRELRNLLTSYADEADLFAETIQNAFDALQTAIDNQAYENEETPVLTVVLGRRTNDRHYLFVADNGIGMEARVAKKFTIPGFTLRKRLGQTVGYKGVGASFFFAASNKISFSTTSTEGETTAATVSLAWDWVMGQTEPEPTVTVVPSFPEGVAHLMPESRGTAVCYYFHDGLKPKNLYSLVKRGDRMREELVNWAHFLASKTALGQTADISQRGIEVRIGIDTGDEVEFRSWKFGDFDRDRSTIGYPYPYRVFRVEKDVRKILETPEGQRENQHRGRHQAIQRRWDKDDLLALNPPIELTDDERSLVEDHFEFFDLFFAYSTQVLDEVHKRSGCRARQLRYGIRIASDGIPQGRMTEFDLTSNQGLGRQAHGLISFKGLELDTGRKIPANEVVSEVIRKIGVRTMGYMADFRWALKKKDRPDRSFDLTEWINRTKERSTSSLVSSLFDALGEPVPIHVDPDSENDVIALFGALLSSGDVKGYALQALSGFNQYDGLIHVSTDPAELRDHNDPNRRCSQPTPRASAHRCAVKWSFSSPASCAKTAASWIC